MDVLIHATSVDPLIHATSVDPLIHATSVYTLIHATSVCAPDRRRLAVSAVSVCEALSCVRP